MAWGILSTHSAARRKTVIFVHLLYTTEEDQQPTKPLAEIYNNHKLYFCLTYATSNHRKLQILNRHRLQLALLLQIHIVGLGDNLGVRKAELGRDGIVLAGWKIQNDRF
jgi:hypothetical protein